MQQPGQAGLLKVIVLLTLHNRMSPTTLQHVISMSPSSRFVLFVQCHMSGTWHNVKQDGGTVLKETTAWGMISKSTISRYD